MRNTRFAGATAIGLAALLAAAACSAEDTASPQASPSPTSTVDEVSRDLLPADLRESGVLRIAASFRTPPLTMLEDDGQVQTGLSYEMATLGAKKLGLEPSWSAITYPGQTPAIQAGKVDIVWETTSVNDERLEAATFVIFANGNQSVLVTAGNPQGIKSMSDMCGARIGVSKGSVFVSYVEEQSKKCVADGKPPVVQSIYDGAPSGRLALQSGNIDGYMSGQPDTTYFANTSDGGKVFTAVDLPEIPAIPLGIQIDKGNDVLAKALASLVDTMIKDGSYAALFKKWQMPDSMMVSSAKIVG